METGIVIKSFGKNCQVRRKDKTIIECVIKGNFRIKGIDSTNPLAVGDIVEFECKDNNLGLITKTCERRNYIIRKSTNLSKKTHILAANVDQAILIVTVSFPENNTEFIDRFLMSAEAYRIPVVIVFNKIDLYTEKDNEKLKEWMTIYQAIGYRCLVTSAKNNINTVEFKNLLQDKVSVLSGNSGVGKSSLINAVDLSLHLKTGIISEYHLSGKHVTTFAEMFELQFGGFIIDTPGIRGFGLTGFAKDEIYHFFPEIFKMAANCKFHNCMHINEPDCAVLQAVKDGGISISRYGSYISIFLDDESRYR